jgi:hypothetical protein
MSTINVRIEDLSAPCKPLVTKRLGRNDTDGPAPQASGKDEIVSEAQRINHEPLARLHRTQGRAQENAFVNCGQRVVELLGRELVFVSK